MSSFQKSIVLCSLLVVTWGCATVGLGEERLQPTKVQPLSSARAVPITENALPYFAQGSVYIFDDGTLLIELGGDHIVFSANGDVEEAVIGSVDAIVFQMDTAGLTIAEKNGKISLDKNQRHLRDRNLNIKQVSQINFPKKEKIIEQKNRQALVSLTGTLDLDYDESTGILYLNITDDQTGKSFSLDAPVVSFDNINSNTDRSIDKNNNYSIILSTVDIAASSCSASCNKGNCTIMCNGSCTSGCSSGVPVCKCVGNQPGLPGGPPSD